MAEYQILGFAKAPEGSLVSISLKTEPFSEFKVYKNRGFIHGLEEDGPLYQFLLQEDTLLELVISPSHLMKGLSLNNQLTHKQ